MPPKQRPEQQQPAEGDQLEMIFTDRPSHHYGPCPPNHIRAAPAPCGCPRAERYWGRASKILPRGKGWIAQDPTWSWGPVALFKKGVEVPIENEFRCSEHGRTCEAIRLPEGAGPEDFCLIKMKGSLARRGAAYRASNGQEVELPWNARPVAGYHGEEVPAAVAAVAAMLVVETPVAQPAKQPAEQPQQPQQQQQASAEQQKQSATVAARPAKARMSEDESLLCMRIYWSYLEFFDSKRFKLLTQPVPFTEEQVDFLLSRAARYAARIRVELNSECVKLHKVGGLGIKLMHETVPLYNPLGRPDQFVRDLVHATLLDERAAYVESRVCYVESLTEAAVDRYLWRFSGGRLGKEEQPATEEEEIGESKEAAVAVPAVAVDALMVVAPAAEGQLGKEEQPAMATTAVAMPIRCSEEAAVALPSKAPVAVVAPAPTAPLPCSSAGGQPWWEAMAARATAAQTSLLGRLRRGVHKAYEAAAAAGDWLAGKVEGAYELGKAAVVAARRATGRVAEWWADNVCVNRHMTLAAVAVSIMCALVGWWWGQSRASSMHTTTPIFVMGRTGAAHVRRRS